MKFIRIIKFSLKIVTCVILATVLILIATHMIASTINPLRRSIPRVHDWILEQTPIGTSIEEVLEAVESNNWQLNFRNTINGTDFIRNYGFASDRNGGWIGSNGQILGVESFSAHIGSYSMILYQLNVNVHWGFCDDGLLVNVGIRRGTRG